mgnify:CR=1 FL=1
MQREFIPAHPVRVRILQRRGETVELPHVKLLLDQAMLEIRTRGVAAPPLDELSDATRRTLKYGNIIGVPLAFILIGLIRWRMRERRRRLVVANVGRSPGNLRHELAHALLGDDWPDIVVGCYISNSFPPYTDWENLIYFNDADVIEAEPSWVSADEVSTGDVQVGFINDDEYGLHHDYEVWLERLAPHAPIDQAGPEADCTTVLARTPVPDVGTGACRRQAWPTRT